MNSTLLAHRFLPRDASPLTRPGARRENVPGKSVSAVVLAEANLQDPAIDTLVQLVQATEVTFWMLQPDSEEANLKNSLKALWLGASEPKKRFELIFDHLDSMFGYE